MDVGEQKVMWTMTNADGFAVDMCVHASDHTFLTT
jgi:hypothetical protein